MCALAGQSMTEFSLLRSVLARFEGLKGKKTEMVKPQLVPAIIACARNNLSGCVFQDPGNSTTPPPPPSRLWELRFWSPLGDDSSLRDLAVRLRLDDRLRVLPGISPAMNTTTEPTPRRLRGGVDTRVSLYPASFSRSSRCYGTRPRSGYRDRERPGRDTGVTGCGGDPDELEIELDVDSDGVIVDCDDDGVEHILGRLHGESEYHHRRFKLDNAPLQVVPVVDDEERLWWPPLLSEGTQWPTLCSPVHSLVVGIVLVGR
ncbi:hypothetical protein BDZ89DRAFT_1221917 [Hymenopellis radicata]|nr:hypothetical protein BDZ89DRAFT_1221917 [Hymenopellis radicata]